MTDVETFAANLVRLRGARKVLHTAIAAGISPRTLNHIERGRWVPTQYVLHSLLTALDASEADTTTLLALRNAAEHEHKANLRKRVKG